MKQKDLIILGVLTAGVGYLTLSQQGKKLTKMITQSGIDFLKSVEGFSSKAYYDVKGWSVGFGHFMGISKLEDNISLARGLELLRSDLNWVEKAIKNRVKVPLNENQYSALVSFIYNEGEPNFASSTLLKKLNAGDYVGASNEFAKWNKIRKNGVLVVDNGLVNRREKERRLFLS